MLIKTLIGAAALLAAPSAFAQTAPAQDNSAPAPAPEATPAPQPQADPTPAPQADTAKKDEAPADANKEEDKKDAPKR